MPSQQYGFLPFERSGLAALSDLETPEWKELFALLENRQAEFLAKEGAFRSPEYKWPRDPLHNWSRAWEYPYVYHHLRSQRRKWLSEASPRVVDMGSGVTFFPFAVARLGYHVTCVDIDPICVTDIPRAASAVPHGPGTVDFRIAKGNSLPFKDGEMDAVYCVSVLEHVPNPESTVLETARILKPGGLLLLTIDLDLRGDSEIGVHAHRKLVAALKACFDYELAEATVHPADILDNTKGPFRIPILCGLRRRWFLIKQGIKSLLGKSPSSLIPFYLAVQGFVLTRKPGIPKERIDTPSLMVPERNAKASGRIGADC